MTEEFIMDYRLLIILMFIFSLVNWYLLIVVVARGFNKIEKAIQMKKEDKDE